MTDMQVRRAELRLEGALRGLADAFRGATARPDENNCACHWGSAEELALLKVPDVTLDPDLLRRAWQDSGWSDHGSVLRRILPQLAGAVVDSTSESFPYWDEIGVSLARGHWQEWPAEQAAAVREFLRAFWAHGLVATDPTAQAHTHTHQALVLCAEASGELGPWLGIWEETEHPTADRHLAEAVDAWDYDLLVDRLPWTTWHDEEDMVAVLTAWLTRHAAARLRAHDAPDSLLQRLRLIGLPGDARWEDPYWPQYTY
ncbi:hypothetical protein [Streptacidiphilus melanogenes]|uniref:hypothetical protein n=1 Tax=Streptacidiphilus melanogenes TaxID=411235 RepID=UPI0005A6E1CC|nr:hypothetical protein [Streptacidiphilus melanogenes]